MTDAEKILNDLQELYQRLVLNYNDGVPFEQMEEDRLTVGNAIDLIEYLKATEKELTEQFTIQGKEYSELYKENVSQKAEIDRLKIDNEENDILIDMQDNVLREQTEIINRQNSEIERLQKLALARHLHIEHLNADIRELKETRYSQVKAEAYKDLAEKLKAKKKRAYFEDEGFYWCVLADDIDAVLKEMSDT